MYRSLTLILIIAVSWIIGSGQENKATEEIFSVPDINGRATLLVKPDLPGNLMMDSDGITVTLKVVVDTSGNVISATCSLRCPENVKGLAESAAKESKFAPLVLNGKAVKYDGILAYTFAAQSVNWYGFGQAIQSVHTFDNLSVAPVAAFLTSAYAEEKSRLMGLDSKVDFETRISTIEDVIRLISSKLDEPDAWFFSLGMAMRRISSPFQSDRKLHRDELQSALTEIGKFAESAPSKVNGEVIKKLREIAAFKIAPEASNEELAQAILPLTSKIRFEQRKSH
jgi:hypothetical protein